MRFSKTFVEKVSQAADLVQVISEHGVALKRAGATYKGLCPFHSEQTPSFSVNPQKGFFHCFGCKASGDAIKFLMLSDKLSFVEAVTELANRFGIPLEASTAPAKTSPSQEDRGFLCLQEAAQWYHMALSQASPEAQQARSYLEKRVVPAAMWERFQLGCSPEEWQFLLHPLQRKGFQVEEVLKTGLAKLSEKSGRPYDFFRGRLMFPIRDARGRYVGFGARAMAEGQQPKYLNTPETPYYRKNQVLYGFYEGREAIRRSQEVILCEGYLDVIRLHEFGFAQAVATCGTALTREHVQFLQRNQVEKLILVFDGDSAGQKAAFRGMALVLPRLQAILGEKLDLRIVILPEKDPDLFLLHQGAEAFQDVLKRATPIWEFLVTQTLAKYPSDVAGRTKALDELFPLIAQIADTTQQQMTLLQLAEMLRLPEKDVFQLAKKLRSPANPDKVDSLQPNEGFPEDNRDEKWILQALFTARQWMAFAREHLHESEFQTPHWKHLYAALSELSEAEFLALQPETFGEALGSLADLAMQLYLEGFVAENAEQNLKLYMRRVKERALEREFQAKLLAATEDEKLFLGVERRRRRVALDQLFQRS